MTEALFQFIWQHSLYRATTLATTGGDPITIITPGKINRDAGPDFLEARIKIGNTILVGNIELHLKNTDWIRHGHQKDPAYKNLILHVVFDNDGQGSPAEIPLLELGSHIEPLIPERYYSLMHTQQTLPCAPRHTTVREITRTAWLTRLLAERWEQKLAEWDIMLENSAEDWRNLLYWRMAANFGFKTNAIPFLLLARSLPLNILGRHRDNLMQVEALLFGQAGMLFQQWEDEYPVQLRREYEFLRKKYNLQPLSGHLWKFLRMRPANFPSIRIAQFAKLIHQSEHLFSQVIEIKSAREMEPLLDVWASEYWDTHFRFDGPEQKSTVKSLGKSSVQNIIINTIAPIQFLYAAHQGNAALQESALALLESVPAEQNNITAIWKQHDWAPQNAAQSQGMIQLYNKYCSSLRCLECTVGLNIIKRSS